MLQLKAFLNAASSLLNAVVIERAVVLIAVLPAGSFGRITTRARTGVGPASWTATEMDDRNAPASSFLNRAVIWGPPPLNCTPTTRKTRPGDRTKPRNTGTRDGFDNTQNEKNTSRRCSDRFRPAGWRSASTRRWRRENPFPQTPAIGILTGRDSGIRSGQTDHYQAWTLCGMRPQARPVCVVQLPDGTSVPYAAMIGSHKWLKNRETHG